jgi:hypothetical protein
MVVLLDLQYDLFIVINPLRHFGLMFVLCALMLKRTLHFAY